MGKIGIGGRTIESTVQNHLMLYDIVGGYLCKRIGTRRQEKLSLPIQITKCVYSDRNWAYIDLVQRLNVVLVKKLYNEHCGV